MPLLRLPLATNSYPAASRPLSVQSLVNMYAETQPVDAKSKVAIYQRPGLVRWTDTGVNAGVRLLYNMQNTLYAVIGTGVYRVASNGAITLLGNVTDPDGQVYAADNSAGQLVIVTVTDAKGWVVTATTFAQITDEDFLGAAGVTQLDGYHVFVKPSAETWFLSDLLDAMSYEGFDAATAESQPDGLVFPIAYAGLLWLFGETTIEPWQNTGDPDFPFQRVSAQQINKGTAARGSICLVANTLFWLGNDLRIYRLNGFQPVPVSNHGIENQISTYAANNQISDARSFTFTLNGHEFYVLTFPSANATWVFDTSTETWNQWRTGDSGRWQVIGGCSVYGKYLVGNETDGIIYALDKATYDDDGDELIWQAIGAPFQADTLRATMWSVVLDMEAGTGISGVHESLILNFSENSYFIASGGYPFPGVDPQVRLDWSDDGGNTWSNAMYSSIGRMGDFNARVEFKRLGTFRQRTLRVTGSDPVKAVIYAAAVNLKGNRH